MNATELQLCRRVGAIRMTKVYMTEQGWQVSAHIERIGEEDLVDQSGKVKTFKSLDTVFEALSGMGIFFAIVTSKGESPEAAGISAHDESNPAVATVAPAMATAAEESAIG